MNERSQWVVSLLCHICVEHISVLAVKAEFCRHLSSVKCSKLSTRGTKSVTDIIPAHLAVYNCVENICSSTERASGLFIIPCHCLTY